MERKICFTPPFLFLCIALFLCQSLATDKNVVDNNDLTALLSANVQAEYNKMLSKQADWWWGRPHFPRWPWPSLPPLPAGPSSGGIPKFPWPFVHPPLPSGGFPKFPWPFVPPPIPSGGFKFPPNFPWFHHPWIPPYMHHHHGNNAGAVGVIEDIGTASISPICLSTNEIVESCMQSSSMSHSWGHIFSQDCCKAIADIGDRCHPMFVPMIKHQCSKKATAPPPTS